MNAGSSVPAPNFASHLAVAASPLQDRRSQLSALLGNLGIHVVPAASVAETGSLVAATRASVAVLRDFPVDNELLGLCRSLEAAPTRLIVVGPSAELIDRIIVLELGADEYLHDPVDDRLLTSRLKAVLRRSATASPLRAPSPTRGWELDPLMRHAVGPAGQRVALTAAEMSLFALFIRHRGLLVNEDLAATTLGLGGGAALRNAVSRLRRKLASVGDGVSPIRSVQGMGYTLEP